MFPLFAFLVTLIAGAPPIVPPDAKVEQVATGFRFTEGPALAPDGSIYFTDIPSNRILRFDPTSATVTTVHENTGGANGLMFDREGNLIACCGKRRAVIRYPKDGGEPMVVADKIDGKRFNSPNDVAIDQAGNIWFTDPRYGKRDDIELPRERVYRIAADGTLQLYSDRAKQPNGVAYRDGVLYIADNPAKQLLKVNLADGGVIPLSPIEGPGGPDGMTIDRGGNVYAAWHGGGGVHVWNPAGEHIAFIPTPEQPANCAFGADGRTVYITATKSLYRVVLNVPDVPEGR